MGKTEQTTWVMGEEYTYHECDNCEKLIDGMPLAHWENKNFTLCMDCLINIASPKKSNEKVIFQPTKVKIPSALRWKIWNRDNFTCQYCESRNDLTIDHVFPESLGGGLEERNLVTACHSCNSSKGARTPEEAEMPLLFDPRATGDD